MSKKKVETTDFENGQKFAFGDEILYQFRNNLLAASFKGVDLIEDYYYLGTQFEASDVSIDLALEAMNIANNTIEPLRLSYPILKTSIFLILFSSCFFPNPQGSETMIGKYVSEEVGRAKHMFEYIVYSKSRTADSSLELKADSSYLFESCGNIISGNWQLNGDSLQLVIRENKWQIDSLNRTRPITIDTNKFNIHSYYIEENRLISFFSTLHRNGKEIKLYTILIKKDE